MTPRAYPRLPVEQFGRLTIESGDLDPVYGALVKAYHNGYEMVKSGLLQESLARWLVWYWCTYDCGSACWASEQGDADFWRHLLRAADNVETSPIGGRWPRAPERRHWRGLNAVKSARDLNVKHDTALSMVEYLAHGRDGPGNGPELYKVVRARVQEHEGFGPWIAYKCADMLERVWGTPVLFTREDAMYEEPTRAALMVYREKVSAPAGAKVKDEAKAIRAVVEYLNVELEELPAPGLPGRSVGVQEIETVLCKWKSHVNGHYSLGHDLREIRRGVEPWAKVSRTAEAFLEAWPGSST